MKDEITDDEAQALLKSLNDLLDKGQWDKSNFLKMIGKNITEIRDDLADKLGAVSREQLKAEAHNAKQSALRSGQTEVYISLYSAKGSDLATWERIVANLPRQMISRPIYANEPDIKNIIKHKENQMNEAYVALYVNASDILQLPPDKVVQDKLGAELMNLKDRTIFIENISRFVHLTGIYQLDHGRLVKRQL